MSRVISFFVGAGFELYILFRIFDEFVVTPHAAPSAIKYLSVYVVYFIAHIVFGYLIGLVNTYRTDRMRIYDGAKTIFMWLILAVTYMVWRVSMGDGFSIGIPVEIGAVLWEELRLPLLGIAAAVVQNIVLFDWHARRFAQSHMNFITFIMVQGVVVFFVFMFHGQVSFIVGVSDTIWSATSFLPEVCALTMIAGAHMYLEVTRVLAGGSSQPFAITFERMVPLFVLLFGLVIASHIFFQYLSYQHL